MLVVNLIDKDRVRGDEGLGDSRAVWRARFFLFIGFALMAGGLAGSVVRLNIISFFYVPYLSSFADCSGAQICPERVYRSVYILRLCERIAECSLDAIRRIPLGRPEHLERVRL